MGRSDLRVSVNAAARLDRLPVSAFHRRILTLIGIGMFFDRYDVYVAATVPGATLKAVFFHARSERPVYFRNLHRHDVGILPHRIPRRLLRPPLLESG